jgi:hypothetical protein
VAKRVIQNDVCVQWFHLFISFAVPRIQLTVENITRNAPGDTELPINLVVPKIYKKHYEISIRYSISGQSGSNIDVFGQMVSYTLLQNIY